MALSKKKGLNYSTSGMVQPGRSYNSADYRYGFNGKEKDDEISGNGNSYDYGFRIYNPRLGKFLSVDPLTKNFPSWSPYPFAMNRPIDGIDIDGLEYMDSDAARLEVVNGDIKLKMENFTGVSRGAWRIANDNPDNWELGSIGISKNVGNIKFFRPEGEAKTASNSSTTTNPNKTNEGAIREYHASRGGTGNPSSFTVSGAKATLILDAAIFAAKAFQEVSLGWDNNKLTETSRNLSNSVDVVGQALKTGGYIPDHYQNVKDLSNIINVVLSGVNNSDNAELYDIGIKIYNELSVKETYDYEDNNSSDNLKVNKTVVVPQFKSVEK